MPRSVAWPNVVAAPMSIFLFEGGATVLDLVEVFAGSLAEDEVLVFLGGSAWDEVMLDAL